MDIHRRGLLKTLFYVTCSKTLCKLCIAMISIFYKKKYDFSSSIHFLHRCLARRLCHKKRLSLSPGSGGPSCMGHLSNVTYMGQPPDVVCKCQLSADVGIWLGQALDQTCYDSCMGRRQAETLLRRPWYKTFMSKPWADNSMDQLSCDTNMSQP